VNVIQKRQALPALAEHQPRRGSSATKLAATRRRDRELGGHGCCQIRHLYADSRAPGRESQRRVFHLEPLERNKMRPPVALGAHLGLVAAGFARRRWLA
jgi:hypothetical protein